MTSSSPLPTASRLSPASRLFPKSSSASNVLYQGQISSGDPVRASVAHLLIRAYTLPCSTAAQAFSQLVQPTARFQLALDALLPLLSPSVEVRTLRLHHSSPHVHYVTSPTLARAAHSRFLHLVFNVRSLSDVSQPIQVCSVRYLSEGERSCHQGCRRGRLQ